MLEDRDGLLCLHPDFPCVGMRCMRCMSRTAQHARHPSTRTHGVSAWQQRAHHSTRAQNKANKHTKHNGNGLGGAHARKEAATLQTLSAFAASRVLFTALARGAEA